MKTRLSSNNPFGHNRYGFAFEYLESGMRCLDYGCYDGAFMKKVEEYKNVDFVGVDKNSRIVLENPHGLDLIHIGDNLPFESQSYDCVTMLDVLEHIYDQASVLKEVNRVLKHNGTLIVTVPKKHLFSFLDMKNLAFIFPSIAKWFLIRMYSRDDYEDWYVKNADGLVGDVEREKSWHQHFSNFALQKLLCDNGFTVKVLDGSGLFERIFIFCDFLKIGSLFPIRLRQLDSKRFEQTSLFCRAIKHKTSRIGQRLPDQHWIATSVFRFSYPKGFS